LENNKIKIVDKENWFINAIFQQSR